MYFNIKDYWNMFMPIDLLAFVRLTILPRPILCAFVHAFLPI